MPNVGDADTSSTDTDTDAVRDYLTACFGCGTGVLVVAVGSQPYLTDNGKIKHRHWSETPFDWPTESDKAIRAIVQAATMDDAYLCPYLMRSTDRAKGNAVTHQLVHCDVDDGALDTERVRQLHGFAIASGSPGHGHAYVRLAESVSAEQHEVLCRGLGAYLGATDAKVSDNDVLRPPGTFNHKPIAHGGDPVPVTWLVPFDGAHVDPESLALALGVQLDTPATNGKTSTAAEPVELRDHPDVAEAVAKDTGDRSEDTMRIVGACYDEGLTLAQARWIINMRADLTKRLDDERDDDDVLRCWLKIDADRRKRPGVTGMRSGAMGNGTAGDFRTRDNSNSATGFGAILVTSTVASSVRSGVPEWAWKYDHKGRLMRGTFVLFGGRPSAGKSTGARYFAAGYTNGTIAGCFMGEPLNVAYIATEESLKYIVTPSLLAHGADMSRVHFPEVRIDGTEVRLQSKRDETALTEFLLDNHITIVFVDPVMAAISGKADINRNNETRDYVEPWQRIAEKTDGLVTGIVHLRKNFGTDILAAINGSSAFGEIARAVIAFAREDASGDRVLSQEKNNAGDEDLAMSYTIEPATVQTDEGQAEVGRFVLGELSQRRAGDLLRMDNAQQNLGPRSWAILESIRQSGGPCDAAMVCALIPNLSVDDAGKYMRRLAKAGLLVRHGRGSFDVPSR